MEKALQEGTWMIIKSYCVGSAKIFLCLIIALLVACSSGGGNNDDNNDTSPTPTSTVSGTVTGLQAGNNLSLQLNNAETINISDSGAFAFVTALDDAASFNVSIFSQPTNPVQTCILSNSIGTINGANITNITVTCTTPQTPTYTVGGTVSGLTAGNNLQLQLNGAELLDIGGNGSFVFTTMLTDSASFNVTVSLQPTNPVQTCILSNSNGSINAANVTNISVTCTTPQTLTYSVGGDVSGLEPGNNLVLQLNSSETLPISADGAFSFTSMLINGASYSVTVFSQPTNTEQVCAVTNGSGNISGSSISNISITCITPAPATYTVGGNVNGLQTGSNLQLQLNGAESINITASGSFIFATTLTSADNYEVTVLTQPDVPEQICAISNGSGSVNSTDITDVSVTCSLVTHTIGGTVTGLTGSGLSLQLNGGETLNVSTADFTFVTPVASGQTYEVTVFSQPTSPAQNCNVTNSSGSVTNADITDVAVSCISTVADAPTLAASVSNKQIHFTWGAANGADFYSLLENTGGGFVEAQTNLSGTSLDYDVSALLFDWSNTQYILQACTSGQVCTDSTNTVNLVGEQANAVIYFKASNTGAGDIFGSAVAVSADGAYMAVGAPDEDGDMDSIVGSGAVYVFFNDGNGWQQQAYLKADNAGVNDAFGERIAIDGTGQRIVVCALGEDSNSTGVGGAQNDSLADSGAAYVFVRNGTSWSQEAFFKADNTRLNAWFCRDTDISNDGNTIVVGGNTHERAGSGTGNAYVFSRSSGNWTGPTRLTATNAGDRDNFGRHVKISGDGGTIVVAAPFEDGSGTGSNPASNNLADGSGAVYVYTGSVASWTQQAYIKASNPNVNDMFGWTIDVSDDGNTLVAHAPGEASNATGINGDDTNNSAGQSGAVFAFARTGNTWQQTAYMKAFAGSVYAVGALSADGTLLFNNYSSNSNGAFAYDILSWNGLVWSLLKTVTLDEVPAYSFLFDLDNKPQAISADGSTLVIGDADDGSASTEINGDRTSTIQNAGAVFMY